MARTHRKQIPNFYQKESKKDRKPHYRAYRKKTNKIVRTAKDREYRDLDYNFLGFTDTESCGDPECDCYRAPVMEPVEPELVLDPYTKTSGWLSW